MNDLISRQDAIDAILSEVDKRYKAIIEYRWWNMGLTRASEILKNLPSVQPEQKTGRWEKRYISDYRFQYCCSECGMIQVYGEPNYCPNCGARMDGGDADD